MIFLIKLFFLFIININVCFAEKVENKIFFKINEKVFTKIDLENRIKYIGIINNIDIQNISFEKKSEIYEDYVSSLIFYEYYINKKINFNNLKQEINTLFNKNISNNLLKEKLNSQKNNIIMFNLEIDIVRKKIIENLINSRKEKISKKPNVLDLIYNYNLSYLTIKKNETKNINFKNINNRIDFNKLKLKLKNNKINFLFKNDNINESSITSNLIKKIINSNQNIYIEEKNDYIILISLEKTLESYDGIFVKLINFNTDYLVKKENLSCSNINKIINTNKTIYKEYEYKKLNDKIKKNLKSIDDFILFKEENNNYNYIILCELRYDEKLLNDINFNKKINWFAKKIQLDFLNKYKNEYNYQKIK